MAAAAKAAELIKAEEIIFGPVRCSTSEGVRFRSAWVDSMRNISLMARPTVMKGNTCVLSRFIGRPIRLQTPRAAVAELANTITPNTAIPDWATQLYKATTANTIPSLIKSVLECSLSIMFKLAVENVWNK